MVFCKEDNRELLQTLKDLVQRDRAAGICVPSSFDGILRSLDEMSARNDIESNQASTPGTADIRTPFGPGREEFEILQAYNSLIRAGGRPICQLGETTSISKHPGRYGAILGPWVKGPSTECAIDWKDIFQQQLANWQRFKAWQLSNRGTEVLSTSPKTLLRGPGNEDNRPLAINDYSSRLAKFEAHVLRAKRRLSHCGFTKSFMFDVDVSSQDEWTTWIEYLSFECYCSDGQTLQYHLASLRNTASPKSMCEVDCGPVDCSTRHSYGGGSSRASASASPSPEKTPGDERKAEIYMDCLNESRVTDEKNFVARSGNPESSADIPGTPRQVRPKRSAGDDDHSTVHHNLILKWALLQEPEIAARSGHTEGGCSSGGASWPRSHGLRLKRNRDGSLCNASPVAFSCSAFVGIYEEEDGDLGYKRSRSSG